MYHFGPFFCIERVPVLSASRFSQILAGKGVRLCLQGSSIQAFQFHLPSQHVDFIYIDITAWLFFVPFVHEREKKHDSCGIWMDLIGFDGSFSSIHPRLYRADLMHFHRLKEFEFTEQYSTGSESDGNGCWRPCFKHEECEQGTDDASEALATCSLVLSMLTLTVLVTSVP